MTATRELTQTDALTERIDAQHDELLRKIDELDKQVTALLAEWTAVAEADATIATSSKS